MTIRSNKKLSEWVSQFVRLLKRVEEDYESATDGQKQEDRVLQDYLHKLECSTSKERGKIATALATSRKKRRECKDVMYIAWPLIEWLDKNKPIVKELERVLGEIRHREENEKIYYPRVLAEETIRSGKVAEYKPRKTIK